MPIPQSSDNVVLFGAASGPQGLPGVSGTTRRITAPYTVQNGDGALWVDLTIGTIPITLATLTNNAQIWVNDYLGLATAPVKVTLIGTASGSVNPTLIDIPYNMGLLLYSAALDLWSYKV